MKYWDMLHLYIKNVQLWVCPSHDNTTADFKKMSYGVNSYAAPTGVPFSLSDFTAPAETFIFADGWVATHSVLNALGRYPFPWHNEMANLAWADGHVKAMRTPDAIYDGGGESSVMGLKYWKVKR